MKFNELFESLLCEYIKLEDYIHVINGSFKIDDVISCLIWADCNKEGHYRHLTDSDGAIKLINNKNKDMIISALKKSKRITGVATVGGMMLEIRAKAKAWFPEDIVSTVGNDNTRWVTVTKVVSPKNDSGVFPYALYKEYMDKLGKWILKNAPAIGKELYDEYSDMWKNRYTIWQDNYFQGLNSDVVESNTKELKALVDYGVKLQHDLFKKYGAEIRNRLMERYNDIERYRNIKSGQDEALVYDVKVEKIIFYDKALIDFKIHFDNFEEELSTIDDNVINKLKGRYFWYRLVVDGHPLAKILSDTNFKGLIGFSYQGKFNKGIHKLLNANKYPLTFKFIEDHKILKFHKNTPFIEVKSLH